MSQFDLKSLTDDERALFYTLPPDYQTFLVRTNGGVVNSPNRWFRIPIERTIQGKTYGFNWNEIAEFWSFISYHNVQPDGEDVTSILHEHFDRHEDEGFLPKGVYAIAICVQSSLLCISTNSHDVGSIYYWEWYWRYPWYKSFFDRRIEQASAQFADIQAILSNPEHPEYWAAYNALNYATLVKVGDSFTEFVDNLVTEDEAVDGKD